MWFGRCPCASNRRKQKLTITWMRTSNRSKAVTAKSEGRSAYEPAGLIQTSRQAVHPPGVQSHRFTLALHQKTLMTVSPCCPLPRGSPTLPCEWESKPVSAKLLTVEKPNQRNTNKKLKWHSEQQKQNRVRESFMGTINYKHSTSFFIRSELSKHTESASVG